MLYKVIHNNNDYKSTMDTYNVLDDVYIMLAALVDFPYYFKFDLQRVAFRSAVIALINKGVSHESIKQRLTVRSPGDVHWLTSLGDVYLASTFTQLSLT